MNVVDAINTHRFPNVLREEVVIDGTLTCPAQPARPVPIGFGAGAAISAIAAWYELASDRTVPPFDSHRHGQPKNAITVFDSDEIQIGRRVDKDVVRYIGRAAAVENGVTFVGVLHERNPRPFVCTTDAGSFEVRRVDYDIAVFTYGPGKFIAGFRLPAPLPDCTRLSLEHAITLESGETVRLIRPSGEAIDAAMRRFVD